ncbi:MAG: DUF1553 domain-containing protein [Bacteroidota bacterium]
MRFFLSILLLILCLACQPPIPEEVELAYQHLPDQVDFNFHIRPILADRCYKCHGPDDNTREADLRLDLEEEAFQRLKESGNKAFSKGSLGKSEAWHRITSNDPDYLMPPPESNLSLTDTEKALITRWIEQGAEWKDHWAFQPAKRPSIPDVAGRVINPIDQFVLAKLEEKGLEASTEADRERLIRRLSFDLTGLPPTLEEIDQFVRDSSPTAYEDLVDRMLNSDTHAERMAMEWLDVARFGDTQGMHLDAERYNWPWRDWVIQAFRENIPYDQFITWQLAGDLLPDASREQKLATAFHRNHPASAEGGIPDEEFRLQYVQERTNTTATAFLGLTLECATCHDHKFDPLSQKEYYQMAAFFNNLKEVGMVGEFRIGDEGKGPVHASGPVMLLPSKEAERDIEVLTKKINQALAQKDLTAKEVEASQVFLESLSNQNRKKPRADAHFAFESISPHTVKKGVIHRSQNNLPIDKKVDHSTRSLACGNPEVVDGVIGHALRSPNELDVVFLKDIGTFEVNEPYSAGAWVKTEQSGELQTILGTSGELGNAWRGWDLFLDSSNHPCVNLVSIRPQNYVQIRSTASIQPNEWHHVLFTYDGSGRAAGLALYIDGKKVPSTTDYDRLYKTIVRKWNPSEEWKERPIMVFRSGRFHRGENGVFKGSIDEINIFHKSLTPVEVWGLYQSEAGEEIAEVSLNRQDYLSHYLNRHHRPFQQLTQEIRKLVGQRLAITDTIQEIMVMEDMEEKRKTFILNRGQYNQPLDEVQASTPENILSYSDEFPKNRLGLAQWLLDAQNPLTARVAVNRYWQMVFGTGIVATPHDFGTQGALPTHPELLDWLATTFRDNQWNVRELLKSMVMSATYRQSSNATLAHQEIDPSNTYLARGPSRRLQAEMIRDNALAASGLLRNKIGGPSVKPYQPEKLWDFGAYVSGRYEISKGEDLYRRSMYTYIRRTVPHPAMVAFDAPNRLVCTTKRENTNTPQQALVLLNDPQFMEASRVLAERMQKEGGDSLEEQCQYAFRLLCGRKPNPNEMDLIRKQYQNALSNYQKDPQAAEDLLSVGEAPVDPELDRTQTAALAMLANTLMNFDEAYMKR